MDYVNFQAKTLKMINKIGVDMVVERSILANYSPVTDSYTMATTGYNVKGLISDCTERDIDGTVIQVGDKMILLPGPGLPTALEEEDKVKIIYGVNVWNPISIIPIKPNKLALFYKVHCRA